MTGCSSRGCIPDRSPFSLSPLIFLHLTGTKHGVHGTRDFCPWSTPYWNLFYLISANVGHSIRAPIFAGHGTPRGRNGKTNAETWLFSSSTPFLFLFSDFSPHCLHPLFHHIKWINCSKWVSSLSSIRWSLQRLNLNSLLKPPLLLVPIPPRPKRITSLLMTALSSTWHGGRSSSVSVSRWVVSFSDTLLVCVTHTTVECNANES